jgi:cytochrome P450
MTLIGRLLGVPAEERELIYQWTSAAFGTTTTSHSEVPTALEISEANTQLFVYFAELLEQRRRTARADLLSAMLSAGGRQSKDDALSDEEILFNVHLVLAGGHETVRHALTGCVTSLLEHPDQWRRLKADPSLVPMAIEEVLRWASPALNVMRTATQDIEIGGTTVRRGEQVTLWIPIINRDPEAFPAADSFDVGREPNRHLSFGMGSHFCLGAALARIELTALLQELLENVSELNWAGPARRTRSVRAWGLDYAPITFAA